MHPAHRHGRDAGELKLSEDDQRKLYDLIWKRTIASQMEAARLERTTVTDRPAADGEVGAARHGQVVLFDGFLKVYEEGRDDVVRTRTEAPAAGPQAIAETCRGDESRPRQAGRGRRQRHPVPAFWASSISPSRRRATPRRRWSSGWKSSASAGPRPMPRSSTRSRRAATSQGQGPAAPRGQGAPGDGLPVNYFRRYLEYDFTATLEASSTTSRPATSTTRTCWNAVLEGFSAAVARRRNCASPTCWKRSTRCWSRTSSRRTRMAPTRGCAPIAATGG
jgi:DNA topoisomerase-1